LLSLIVVCAAHQTSVEDVKEGLMALYNSTGGNATPPLWIHNKNWGSPGSYCTWEGITCDTSGFIVTLDQNAGGLFGVIPPEIGLLGDMIGALQMNRNTLTGTLPRELSRLTKLRQLDVQQNQISGTIPIDVANLTQVQMFWVSYNRLTGTVYPVMKAFLDRCAAYQPLGCRLQGNLFTCPTPTWVPVECNMLCVGR